MKKSRGYVLVLVLVFLGIFFGIGVSLTSYVTIAARAERQVIEEVSALRLAEAAMDKAAYELNANPSYTGEANTALGDGTFTIAVTPITTESKLVTATAFIPDSVTPRATRTIKTKIGLNDTVISFRYGIQAGNGGFVLKNSSSVTGNVFSSGPIIGDGGNVITGDVVSAGASGLVYGVDVSGSALSHTIGSAVRATDIGQDAYYATTKVNTTVGGVSYPGSPDQGTVPLPISDAQIAAWEVDAEAGGTATCTGGKYEITGSVTIGPLKIPCDLEIKGTGGGYTVTIAGPIWVVGDITTSLKVTLKMDAALGSTNVAIIAHDPANPTTKGTIQISQNVSFLGSGSPGSFVFMVSQNTSAENSGSTSAVTMNNGASALVAYASHGLITLEQSANVKEATAYKILLKNSANVTYDSGLPSAVFQTGPGGSWTFTPGTYTIVD